MPAGAALPAPGRTAVGRADRGRVSRSLIADGAGNPVADGSPREARPFALRSLRSSARCSGVRRIERGDMERFRGEGRFVDGGERDCGRPGVTSGLCRASSIAACCGARASSSSKAASRASRRLSLSSSTMFRSCGARKSGSICVGDLEPLPRAPLLPGLPCSLPVGDAGRLNGEPGGATNASRIGTPTFMLLAQSVDQSKRQALDVRARARRGGHSPGPLFFVLVLEALWRAPELHSSQCRVRLNRTRETWNVNVYVSRSLAQALDRSDRPGEECRTLSHICSTTEVSDTFSTSDD